VLGNTRTDMEGCLDQLSNERTGQILAFAWTRFKLREENGETQPQNLEESKTEECPPRNCPRHTPRVSRTWLEPCRPTRFTFSRSATHTTWTRLSTLQQAREWVSDHAGDGVTNIDHFRMSLLRCSAVFITKETADDMYLATMEGTYPSKTLSGQSSHLNSGVGLAWRCLTASLKTNIGTT
jgi:hypothetical protein